RPPTIQALQQCDAVIAVSRHLAQRVEALGVREEKISVVYNGIDRDLFSPGSREAAREQLGLGLRAPLVLYVGNLLPVKGVDVLIEACAHLARRRVDFQCRIIGQGPIRRALMNQIAGSELTDRVQLIGPRSLEELPDWYRAANVLVLPSRSEGVPNVLLEAMGCGTPVIASNVGGVPEIAPPHALIPSEDSLTLAEALERAISDPYAMDCLSAPTWHDSAAALARV